MNIDHICFAVSNIEEGIRYWETTFGYAQWTRAVVNTLQKVRVVFMHKDDSIMIKLIEPLEENQSLLNYVNKGGGFHHLCFRVDNMEQQIEELKGKGLLTLVPPQPGEAFNNHDIAFMLAKYGINVELIDTDEKASIIKME